MRAIDPKTILLVDDDPMVRDVTRAFLERGPYRVIEAVDGDDALALLDRLDYEIDLLVTDVLMPRVDGRELAMRVARHDPRIPVLLISGFCGFEKPPADMSFELLMKPFGLKALLLTVERLLDASAAGVVTHDHGPRAEPLPDSPFSHCLSMMA